MERERSIPEENKDIEKVNSIQNNNYSKQNK